jgi:hypothetical protein
MQTLQLDTTEVSYLDQRLTGVIQSYTSQPATVAQAGTSPATVTSISSTSVVDGSAVVGDRLAILLTGVGTVTVNIYSFRRQRCSR